MKKFTKRSLAILLALVMLLALSVVPVFADVDRPTGEPTPVATPSTIDHITISGANSSATAYYEKDNNTGDDIYIRAKLDTEYDLESTEIDIYLVSSGTTVSGTGLTFSGGGTTTRTASNVDLLNQAYSVVIGSETYTLAAGYTDQIYLTTSDPLRVENVELQGDPADVYGAVVQSPFMGNPYFGQVDQPWTDPNINYFVSCDLTSAPADRSEVAGVIEKDASASIPDTGSCTTHTSGNNYDFDLSTAVPNFTVTTTSGERLYRVLAVAPGDVENVTYRFDFTELGEDIYKEGFPYYQDNGPELRALAAEIQDAATAYFGGQPITVASGTTVMDVVKDFTDWAVANEYISEATYGFGGGYLVSINDLGEFDGGSNSGWMYTDEGYSPTCGVPGVGANYYPLTSDDTTIDWFYTTDYTEHPFRP